MKRLPLLLTTPVVIWILLLVPILGFTVFFIRYSINVPWLDDFENIPYFLQQFLDQPSWSDKADALFRPNNEHRVLYARLMVLLHFGLTGKINFLVLMAIGNASFLVVLFLFYRSLRRASLPIWYLLPVPFLLFNAQDQLLTFTALFTLQYLAIIMLVFLSIDQLAKNTPLGYGLGILLAMLTTFSMGNGMFVWPAGAVVLIYQRHWPRLGLWLMLMAVTIFLYFYGYPVLQGNEKGFAFLTEHVFQIISGFFVFVGGIFDPFPKWPVLWRSVVPFVAGLTMVGFLAVWCYRTLLRDKRPPTHWNSFFLGCLVFLISNALIVALFRTRFGFDMMLWGSYRAYAMVFSAVAYLVFIGSRRKADRIPGKWVAGFTVLAAGIAGFSYLIGVPLAAEYLHMNQAKIFDQRYNQTGLGGAYDSRLGHFIADHITLMEKRGWYEMPQPSVSTNEQDLIQPISDPTQKMDWKVWDENHYVSVESYEAGFTPDSPETVYLILKSGSRTYLWMSVKRRLSTRNPLALGAGFASSIPKSVMAPGRYRLGIYEVQPDGPGKAVYSDRFVTVE